MATASRRGSSSTTPTATCPAAETSRRTAAAETLSACTTCKNKPGGASNHRVAMYVPCVTDDPCAKLCRACSYLPRLFPVAMYQTVALLLSMVYTYRMSVSLVRYLRYSLCHFKPACLCALVLNRTDVLSGNTVCTYMPAALLLVPTVVCIEHVAPLCALYSSFLCVMRVC